LFEHTLKDADNGADRDPAIRYYTLGDVTAHNAPGNEWRTSDVWPPAGRQPTPFYLHNNLSLSRIPPSRDNPSSLRYTYQHVFPSSPPHPIL